MLRVVPGMPMDGRGERLLAESLAGGRRPGYLHLVRTRARERQLHDLEMSEGFRIGSTVATLSDLVRRLAGRRTRLRAALGEAERALLLDELAREEARPPLRGVDGLASWLGELFSRLKQGGAFGVEQALSEFRSLDRDDPGTSEALRLFGRYQARLVELRMYDEDGLYLEVARDFGSPELPFDRLARSRERLVVEGFYQTNVVERAIFERFFAAFQETLWLVDHVGGAAPGAAGPSVLSDRRIGGVHLAGDLSWLSQCGVDGVTGGDLASCGLDSVWTPSVARRTELAVASDERVEARFLAERAAALVRGDPDASVVIAFPSDRQAAPLMLEACADVDLPLEVAARRTLAECAPARSLLRILALSVREFPREQVVAALRGAAGGVMLGGVRLTAPLVDRISRRAGVIAGVASWRRKLDRLAARRAFDLASATGDARARAECDAADAAQVRAGMIALFELIPAAGARISTAEFVQAVRDVLLRFGLGRPEQAPAGPLDPAAVEALAVGARARSAFDSAIETCERAAGLGQGVRAWSDHVAALSAVMAATSVPFPPPLSRGARLVGMRELRGLVTDHLLVGGLSEDAFPGATAPTPLLGEADAALAGAHTSEARRREAEHLLVQALYSPRKSLLLSRPAQREGCEALPALALEPIRERVLAPEISADDSLARGPVLGRGSRARRAAAALADAQVPAADAEARFQALVEAGADARLAWHRLCAERERHHQARVGRFEGMLEDAARPLLLPESGRMAMSASRFEDYVKCPLRYFFKRVLELGPSEEAGSDVTALDRGSVIHTILYRFHKSAAASAESRDERARALDRIAREEVEELRYDGLYAEVFLDFLTCDLVSREPSDRPGLLRRYLDREDGRRDGFRGRYFEARFGPSPKPVDTGTVISKDPILLFELEHGDRRVGVTLVGSIDRVDLMEDGGELLALVLDYKTGDVMGNRNRTERGQLFQLPLYSRVLAPLLGADAEGRSIRVIAAADYRLRSPSELGIAEPLVEEEHRARIGTPALKRFLPPGGFERLLEGSVLRARDVVVAQLEGRFHPTALDDFENHCRNCEFAHACRGKGEASRLSRMEAAGLFRQAVDLVSREGKARP